MSVLLRPLRILLTVLVTFLWITAIPGGLALLVGFYAPPTSMLEGSVFSDFTIPGLTLMVLVGGTAAAATFLLARGSRFALTGVSLSGIVVMAFEFFQVLVIGSPAGPSRVMQLLYFFLGLSLVAISLAVRLLELTARPGPPSP